MTAGFLQSTHWGMIGVERERERGERSGVKITDFIDEARPDWQA